MSKGKRSIKRSYKRIQNLSELLANTTDVVVANVVQPLLIFTLNRFSLAKDNSVWGNDAEVARIGLDNLEQTPRQKGAKPCAS